MGFNQCVYQIITNLDSTYLQTGICTSIEIASADKGWYVWNSSLDLPVNAPGLGDHGDAPRYCYPQCLFFSLLLPSMDSWDLKIWWTSGSRKMPAGWPMEYKISATKIDDLLSWIPGTYMVEERTPTSCPLTSKHRTWHVYMSVCPYAHMQTIKIKE